MYLLTPLKNVTGKNTMEVVNVAASTAIETSVPPYLRGHGRRFSHLHVAKDVFEHDNAVIDEPGEDQRQTAQKHGIDGAAHVIGDQQADHHRERNGKQHGDRGAGAAQENQDHHAGQHQSDAGFLRNVPDRQFDEDGLVEDNRGLQRCRNVDQMLDGGLHAVHDGDGVAVAALFEDRHVDGALSIDAHNVVLQGA